MGSFTTWLADPKNQPLINTGINAIGGALASAGDAKSAEETRRLQQQNLAQGAVGNVGDAYRGVATANTGVANAASDQYTGWLNDQNSRAQGVLKARPLGAEQSFEQYNARQSAMLPGIAHALGTTLRPSDSSIRVPDLGINIDPSALARLQSSYSADNTARSIGQFNNDLSSLALGKNAPNMSMEGLYGAKAQPYTDNMRDWASGEAGVADSREAEMRAQVAAALDQNVSGANEYLALAKQREQEASAQVAQATAKGGDKKKGFWGSLGGKIGSVLKVAAPIGLGLIPGIGAPLGMALGAGLGAGSSALQGKGWKGALLGGAAGAIPGAGGALTKGVTSAATKALIQGGLGAAGGALQGGAQGALQGGIGNYLSARYGAQPPAPVSHPALPAPRFAAAMPPRNPYSNVRF